MSKTKKIQELESLVYNLEVELQKTKSILGELSGKKKSKSTDHGLKAAQVGSEDNSQDGVVVEGVFNGQIMIGPDGKQYSVPANYASKSKLVEGDLLKLTIDNDGSFIFKQIAPVDRARLVGRLVKDQETDEFVALTGDKIYKLLMASITYFKGSEGDEVVILVPKDADGVWAAVENIIKNNNSNQRATEDFEITL